MKTPTRISVDLATGQISEIELEGAELEAYNVSLAQQLAELAKEEAAKLTAQQSTVTE